MIKHTKLTEDRIVNAFAYLDPLIYPLKTAVDIAVWRVEGEPVPLQTALQAPYTPFAVGDAWGPQWDTAWFRVQGRIPESWTEREVVVLMQLTDHLGEGEGFTAEGMIYRDGNLVRALNANRKDIEVTNSARGGEGFEFYIEAAANIVDRSGIGGAIIERAGPLFRLAQAELASINREAFDYYYDYKVAMELMVALPADSQRRAELRYALNESLNILDVEDPVTIAPARAALAEVLAKKNGDTVHTISAVGHAHIDTAWLWPLRESIRKCARTFSTALDYMEDYPNYVFGCSQAQQYAWMKHYYPAVYEGIREQVKRGQWEPIGSMWVEPDCNLASGESLIRQIVYGKRFFKEAFGYETRDAWLPDVFGYSAALPQIYRGCGIDLFVTQKLSWSQLNKFPHQTFLWEGIDGTQIFSHFPPSDTYSGRMSPKELAFNVSNFKEHGHASCSLYPFGFGDGGGGPTITMLEQAKRMQNLEGLPKVKLEKVADFSTKVKADARDLPVWVGELYLEFHRGTYTTHARNKRANRAGEFLLRDAEFLETLSLVLVENRSESAADPERAIYDVFGLGAAEPHRHAHALERAWKLLLLNQFHDIIPGSSIHWVYEDSARDYQTITELGDSVLQTALHGLNGLVDTSGFEKPVGIFNTLGFERREVIELNGKQAIINLPACGYRVVDTGDGGVFQIPESVTAVSVRETNGEILIENGLVRLCITREGLLKSIIDLEAGDREVIAPGHEGNLLQLHPDINHTLNDAWDIDIYYKQQVETLRGVDRIRVLESGPLLGRIQIERSFGKSKFVQEIILKAGSKRIDFDTQMDWREKNKLLRVAFPVNIHSSRATHEIQFGHVERPTHYNTSWDVARFEVCAHKWADLSETGYGVALLNDCKYGYDIHDNILSLSLLRSTTSPDPTADQGFQQFTYAILPHVGDLTNGRVIEEAYQLNVPPHVTPLTVQPGVLPATQSFFETDRAGVLIETIKPADEGSGFIVRLYEAHGSRGPVTFRTTLTVQSISRADLLENPIEQLAMKDGAVVLNVTPFEIITLRFETKH